MGPGVQFPSCGSSRNPTLFSGRGWCAVGRRIQASARRADVRRRGANRDPPRPSAPVMYGATSFVGLSRYSAARLASRFLNKCNTALAEAYATLGTCPGRWETRIVGRNLSDRPIRWLRVNWLTRDAIACSRCDSMPRQVCASKTRNQRTPGPIQTPRPRDAPMGTRSRKAARARSRRGRVPATHD
jgi:hypothetical protein